MNGDPSNIRPIKQELIFIYFSWLDSLSVKPRYLIGCLAVWNPAIFVTRNTRICFCLDRQLETTNKQSIVRKKEQDQKPKRKDNLTKVNISKNHEKIMISS